MEPDEDRPFRAFTGKGFRLGADTDEADKTFTNQEPAESQPAESQDIVEIISPAKQEVASSASSSGDGFSMQWQYHRALVACREVAASWRVELEQQEAATSLITEIDDYLANVVMLITSRKQITQAQVQQMEERFAELAQLKGAMMPIDSVREESQSTLPWGDDDDATRAMEEMDHADDEDDTAQSGGGADQVQAEEAEEEAGDSLIEAADTEMETSDDDCQPLVPKKKAKAAPRRRRIAVKQDTRRTKKKPSTRKKAS